MQVLVLAVQNAVAYEVLGAATSGVTWPRDRRLVRRGDIRNDLHDPAALAAARASHGPLGAQVVGGGRLTGAQVSGSRPPPRGSPTRTPT